MADAIENLFGKLLGYGLLACIVAGLAVAVAPFAILVGAIVGLFKLVQAINRASLAKKEFLRQVEPPLKSLEDEAARGRKALDGDGWRTRLSNLESALAKVGA